MRQTRRRIETRMAIGAWSRDTATAAGLLEAKADKSPLRWMWRALFVLGALLPTWDGESTVVFVAAFGLLGAWLVSSPLLVAGIADLDLAGMLPRVPELWKRIVGVAGKYETDLPQLTEADQIKLVEVAPTLAKELAGGAFVPKVAGVAFAVGEGLAVALLGLMVGPLLQHIRFGYWSPVSLLFGAVLPSVAMAASTLVAAVLGRALVVSLGANERIQVALTKTDTVMAERGRVQPVPDGQEGTDDSQG